MKIPEINPEKLMKMSLGEFVAFMKASKFDIKLTIETKDKEIYCFIKSKETLEDMT